MSGLFYSRLIGPGGSITAAPGPTPAPPPPPPPPAPAVAPGFGVSPSSRSAQEGDATTFSATVSTGDLPITVRWQRNGVDIAGTTSTISSLPAAVTHTRSAAAADSGAVFRAAATNPGGTAFSGGATLTVTQPDTGVYPETGEAEAALLVGDRAFGQQLGGHCQYWDAGVYRGRNIKDINNTTFLRYTDGQVVLGREPYPPNAAACDAIAMRYRRADYTGTGTDRTQINWSVANVTPAQIQRFGAEHWAWMDFCFNTVGAWPAEMLIWQMHANKNVASWGNLSPPFALYIASNGSGGSKIYMRCTRAVMGDRGTGENTAQTFKTVDVIPSVQANTRYTFVCKYRLIDNNTGYLTVWINGVQFNVLTADPTHFPVDSLELDAAGNWKTDMWPFVTISLYRYRSFPTSFDRKLFVSSAGYRRDRAGMSEAAIRARILQQGKYQP